MDQTRDELFARPRRPGDQDTAVGGRDRGDQLTELLSCRRLSDEAVRGDGLSTKPAIFPFEARLLQGALNQKQETVRLERLLQKVIGAALYC